MKTTTKRPLGRPRTVHFEKLDGISHGKTTGYNKGCRCPRCFHAMSRYKQQAYYDRKIDAYLAS